MWLNLGTRLGTRAHRLNCCGGSLCAASVSVSDQPASTIQDRTDFAKTAAFANAKLGVPSPAAGTRLIETPLASRPPASAGADIARYRPCVWESARPVTSQTRGLRRYHGNNRCARSRNQQRGFTVGTMRDFYFPPT